MKAPGGFLHIPAGIFACIASTLEQGRDSNPTCLPRGSALLPHLMVFLLSCKERKLAGRAKGEGGRTMVTN